MDPLKFRPEINYGILRIVILGSRVLHFRDNYEKPSTTGEAEEITEMRSNFMIR